MEKYENLNLADDIFDHSDPETLQERSDELREGMAEEEARDEARESKRAMTFENVTNTLNDINEMVYGIRPFKTK